MLLKACLSFNRFSSITDCMWHICNTYSLSHISPSPTAFLDLYIGDMSSLTLPLYVTLAVTFWEAFPFL